MIDIVCCTDTTYVKYCCVMLTSLLENNQVEETVIHILDNGIDKGSKELIRDIVERKYHQKLFFYTLDNNLLQEFPSTNSYVSLTTYCKLFIPSILPLSVHQVLYMDCDIIVVNSLYDLWNYDLTDKAVAAVKDDHKGLDKDCERLGYDYYKDDYYNAGVVLLNLDYLRNYDYVQKAINYVAQNSRLLKYHDQDVLNGLLHGHILPLPYRYNLHDNLYHNKRYSHKEQIPIIEEELNPSKRVIIHFSSRRKPWDSRCLHPLRKLYFAYLDMTIWKGERPKLTIKDLKWRWNRILSGWLRWTNGYRNALLS